MIEYEDLKKSDDEFTRFIYDIMKGQLSFWLEKRVTQSGKDKYYWVKGTNQIDYDVIYDIFMCVVARCEFKEDYMKDWSHKEGQRYPSHYDDNLRNEIIQMFEKVATK